MSHNVSPLNSEKETVIKAHSLSSPNSAKVSNDKQSQSQKENKEFIIRQSPTDSSLKENRKKMESLNRKIHFLEFVRIVFLTSLFLIGLLSISMLYKPVKVCGMSLYSFFLISHSLSYLGLSIVHYQLLPPLIDKSSIIGSKIKEECPYLPAYHRSKNELFWCYLRIFLAILINAGIWKYLTYMDFPYNKGEGDQVIIICFSSGVLMLLVYVYVFANLGPVSAGVIIEKPKSKQKNQDTNMLKYDASYLKLLQKKDKISLEKDKILMELLQEKAKENERLRRRTKKQIIKQMAPHKKRKVQRRVIRVPVEATNHN
ncbi:hypothetical protein MOSE0_J10044 [Monosporozyma servazzii]